MPFVSSGSEENFWGIWIVDRWIVDRKWIVDFWIVSKTLDTKGFILLLNYVRGNGLFGTREYAKFHFRSIKYKLLLSIGLQMVVFNYTHCILHVRTLTFAI